MQYLSYISNSYACNNNLQKAIHAYLISQERLIIDWSTVEHFKKRILEGIANINENNPRCKAVDASWWSGNDKGDFHLSLGSSICNFHIYYSK